MMKAVCMACGEEFEAMKGHLCEPCSKDYTVGVSKKHFSFTDQLMSAMRPLTRQIDNLCYNNELLGEILSTLILIKKQPIFYEELKNLVLNWKDRRRIIKED